MKDEPYKLVDLFCGCGGFSAGFVGFEGEARWRVLLGIDVDKNAVDTFKTNFGELSARQDDLALADPVVYMRELGLSSTSLDHMHASPPCQDYSANNRKNGSRLDSRYEIALRWSEVLRPKIVTIENVRELGYAHGRRIGNRLRRLGYTVCCFDVDAADFGVPQHRKRVFYFAYLRCLGARAVSLRRTHGRPQECRGSKIPWVTARKAIEDLPERTPGDGRGIFTSRLDLLVQTSPISDYARVLRPSRGRIITEHEAMPLSQLALSRIKSLLPGQAIAHLPPSLRPRNGFRGAYGRLDPDQPSKTITTGIRGPSHGPFCHYDQDRLLTLREAARLQSFPDSFVFKGGRCSRASQIGNAVPPLLARAFRSLSEMILDGGGKSATQPL